MRLMFFRQVQQHSDNFSYVIADDATREAAVVDSSFNAGEITRILKAENLKVDDGDVIRIGSIPIKVIHTPGHTSDSICLLVDNQKLLTGDTLFVGECGRTDLPSGNSKSMYHSLFHKILKLNDDVEVYPGHDYGSKPSSTIREERRSNYTLEPRSLAEFIEFMSQP
jgi:hydroxyacylglutathione hydrolase